jgi:hypothetical protein
MQRLVLFALLLAFAISGAGQERFVKPVDEAAKDQSFLAFRTKLIDAAKRKNAKYVLSVIDPKIQTDEFGGDLRSFKKEWENLSSESLFWDRFLPAISNGGRFEDGAGVHERIFWAPYVNGDFPGELEPGEHSVIIAKDVAVHEKPTARSPVITKLSYNIVKIFHDELDTADEGLTPAEIALTGKNPEPFFWVKIETDGGKVGYVMDAYLRSPLDYRAGFEKKGGRWVMTYFLAGRRTY